MNNSRSLLAHVLAWSLLVVAGPVKAAEFQEDALVAETGSTYIEQAVTLDAAGNYEVVLEDLGQPTALDEVALAVSDATALLGRLDATGTLEFNVAASSDTLIRVVGRPAAGQERGRVRVIVRRAGAVDTIADFQGDIADLGDSGTSGQVSFNSTFEVLQSGPHDCRLSDLRFPEELLELQVTISRGSVDVCTLDPVTTDGQFNAVAGSYSVVASARARSTTGAGLLGIEIANAGQPAYQATVPVGALQSATPLNLPATGAHTLSLVDQNFPVPLTGLNAILLRGIDLLGRQDGVGVAGFQATAGKSELFEYAATTSPTGGAYGIELDGLSGPLLSEVRIVAGPDPQLADAAVFQFRVELQAAGDYSLDLTDFEFQTPFQALQVVVNQGPQLLGSATAGQALTFAAGAGFLVLTVVSELEVPDAISLFGLRLLTVPGGVVVFEQTQASGSPFKAYSLDIATAGSYDIDLTDFGFPAAFRELSAAVSRGTQREGFVFGAGRFSFDAVAGRYFINIVAKPDSDRRYGLFAISADPTPPPPTVDFDASPATVDGGGTTALSWSSQGATQCAASGGWSGARALSGQETSGPLSAVTTFTLSCSGDGGTTERSVTVNVRSGSGSNGGGGTLGLPALLALAGLVVLARGRRAPLPVH